LLSLMGYPYTILLPVFASQILHGGAMTLGWLTAATGTGALASAISLALRRSGEGLARMLQIAAAMLGGALILFGFSHTLWLSLLLMVFAGFGLIQCAAVINTIIQSLVTEDKRARVMGYYTMAFFGAAPFGSLMAGLLAHKIGAPHTVMVTGACCIAGAMWFTGELPMVKAAMQTVYHEMGVLPREPRVYPILNGKESPNELA
jgi:MFS family permease